ncbi:class II fructose-bisphosphate aldolase [Aureliella helgolandensis]|uniref:Fructose-1,6-bisphosphate aldolase n=1 Tax=Aureliella helgolandensis TaxID=2527968 RepID=A0A518G6P3_9BACT|nr:class II fructose-bisphosphate aldolase [Aureliella helgolandensis]QDV24244.1 Fructose-bisphosphate aldolase [Aureliella helgolandensis]
MALVPLRVVLDHAAENDYGVAAFNVNNMEQIQAIMEAADETDSPAIIQASRGARAYSQDAYLRHLMQAAAELYPHIPVVMHQDHGNSVATCLSAIENNFTSVMMDGSLEEDGKTPASFEYNVRVTKEVVKLAHARGVSVEGELGVLGSLESGEGEQEDGHGAVGQLTHDQLLTDPEEAAQFVEATGVDALAVAIGTSHGAYKFSRKPDGEVLAMKQIEAIHARLPNTHLVMHGSSSVPQELQDIINKYGGKMKQTYGVPVEEIQRGIKSGVRKINVDTDCRMAITGAIRKVLLESPEKFDPRDYLKPARQAMKEVCVARMTAFGQAGNASKMRQAATV